MKFSIPSQNGFAGERPVLAARISGEDLEHLQNFSADEKLRIMRAAMTFPPVDIRSSERMNEYEKHVLKLRAGGFRLIELEFVEFALNSIWYRRTASLLGFSRMESVVALDWECDASGGGTTTFRVWRLP